MNFFFFIVFINVAFILCTGNNSDTLMATYLTHLITVTIQNRTIFLFSFQMVKGRVIRLIIGKRDIFVLLLVRFWALLYNRTIWQQRHIHHSKNRTFRVFRWLLYSFFSLCSNITWLGKNSCFVVLLL